MGSRRWRVVLAAGLLAAAGSSIAGSVVATPGCDSDPAVDQPYRSIDGVDPLQLSLDVFPAPGACAAPVAVWVHGGGWRAGDKDDGQAERAAFYNGEGWLLVSVNYRLSRPAAEPPVSYPDHNEDVAAALAWVAEHVAEHGGDPARVLLIGHSAGATIAASVIADPAYLAVHGLDPSWLRCVVLLDTAGFDVAAIARASDLYRYVFGSDPAVWHDASPAVHVGEGPLPARVLVVTRGSDRRVGGARAFADQLRDAGADADVVDVSPLTHDDVNGSVGSADPVMTPLIAAELERCEGNHRDERTG